MSPIWLRHVSGKCPSQYDNTVDGTSVVCSLLFWDVKQNIMCGRWNAMLMAMTDGKTIMQSSKMLYRAF